MDRKKEDRRVARTKRAIYSAFAQLLSERDIDDITISDIVNIADINRKTFYNYYSGIYDLLNEIEDNIVRAFEAAGDEERAALYRKKMEALPEKMGEFSDAAEKIDAIVFGE